MGYIQNVRVCTKTDIGFKREKNEDSYIVVDEQSESADIQKYGLNDMLTNDEIKRILSKRNALNKKCDRLVADALKRGGKDNVTVIVIET